MPAVVSSVSKVVVFECGALVTRAASSPGDSTEAVLEGLPLCLEYEGLRVELGADAVRAGWSVVDARVEVHAPAGADAPRSEHEQALAAAKDAARSCQERLAATEASIKALSGVQLKPRMHARKDERPSHDPTRNRVAWLELQAEALAELRASVRTLRAEVRQADDAYQALLDAEAARSSARAAAAFEPRKRVVVELRAGQELASVAMEVTYRVPGARWAPAYSLRLGPERGATLELRAVVAQNTGEDWEDARMTVSTASLQTWHDLPRLDALKVGRSQRPVQRAGWREPPPDPIRLFADHDRARRALTPGPLNVPGGSAGPPSPKRAPPAPASAPAPAPMAELAEEAFGGMAAPGGAAPMKSMAKRARARGPAAQSMTRAGGAPVGTGFGSPSFQPEPQPEPEHGLGRAWSDFGRLRLPMPWESRRGRLRRVALLSSRGEMDEVDEAVFERVQRAIARAQRLESGALPPGHAWVRARPGHAHAYACEAAVRVPADGQGHLVSLLEASLETSRRYVCVPAISADVFRTLSASNPLDVPLPPGPLDVYDGDAFVLTSALEPTAARGRFELGLGVEQAIKVARNVEFSEESEGLLKKQNAYAHRVRVDVQNLLGSAAALEVRERVPVPASHQDDDIDVSESEAQPPWDHYKPKDDPLEGGRRWRVEVPAGEKTTLRASWTVRVPGGSELVGGNRRSQ